MPSIFLTFPATERTMRYGDEAIRRLSALGNLRLNDTPEILSTTHLIRAAQGCDVIVADRLTPGEPVLFRELHDLAAFVRCARDVRNIDITAASRHGVLVTRAGPGFIDAMTELTLGQMVCLAREIPEHVAAYRAGREPWPGLGLQLARKTLGIIGYGNVGRRLGEVAAVLGMRVLVCDPYTGWVAPAADRVGLSTLLRESDFVVCLAVYSEETHGLIEATAFSQMKPTAYFINNSRGGLVDEDALEKALEARQIAGAALDVGKGPDDRPTARLGGRPDVLATAHIGGLVPESISYQALETVEQTREILSGRIPQGALNADAATRLRRFRPS